MNEIPLRCAFYLLALRSSVELIRITKIFFVVRILSIMNLFMHLSMFVSIRISITRLGHCNLFAIFYNGWCLNAFWLSLNSTTLTIFIWKTLHKITIVAKKWVIVEHACCAKLIVKLFHHFIHSSKSKIIIIKERVMLHYCWSGFAFVLISSEKWVIKKLTMYIKSQVT